jgi:berberine-like enzyme
MFDADLPKGLHYYEKHEFLPVLSTDCLDAFRTAAVTVNAPVAESVIFHLAGALNERDDDDGAVGNREARYVSWFATGWSGGAAGNEQVAWVRQSWQSIRRFGTGGSYVNFQMGDDESTLTSAYGANYDRLRGVKAHHDPDNLFRVNRNISPA